MTTLDLPTGLIWAGNRVLGVVTTLADLPDGAAEGSVVRVLFPSSAGAVDFGRKRGRWVLLEQPVTVVWQLDGGTVAVVEGGSRVDSARRRR